MNSKAIGSVKKSVCLASNGATTKRSPKTFKSFFLIDRGLTSAHKNIIAYTRSVYIFFPFRTTADLGTRVCECDYDCGNNNNWNDTNNVRKRKLLTIII